MMIVGIDLSGPTNRMDTCLVYFQANTDHLMLRGVDNGADDQVIYDRISELAQRSAVVVGLDAPLSYNIGGGDRPADFNLRQAITQAGLRSGSVMTPTMSRMVYLTLRGVSLTRSLAALRPPHPLQIIEAHPGATFALRHAPIEAVLQLKSSAEARWQLLAWLEGKGLEGVTKELAPTDHYVAACACALAAWKWSRQETVWLSPANLPYHPYDLAC